MAIQATSSSYKKNTHKILILALIGFAVYCVYDGYYNQSFIEKHTLENGQPNSTLAFNKKAPPFLAAIALAIGVNLFRIWNKKIVAGDESLSLSNTEIPYNSIESINKTYFDSKGFFTVTYKDSQGKESTIKVCDKDYDNLPTVLDEIVAKIS
ncbi:MAG: hypothetical protein JW912_07270 [Sedimentisphaerales bacterium]|nr:hypothetical protein [Sedimentisphaerales bacterium]